MPVNEHDNEKLLVQELMAHDETAFRKLFDHYRRDIFAYSKSMLKDAEYAREIVQDVFLRVWLNRENLDPELSFRAYIFTITRNLTINFLHKAANDRSLREVIFYKSQQWYNPADESIREVDFEVIRKNAIDTLPPKCRQIFEMSRNNGMSYEEISRELGISVNTVRNQITKALEIIRTFLQANGYPVLVMFILLFASYS